MMKEDNLSFDGICEHLPQSFDKSKIRFFHVINSTNTEAKRMAAEGAPDGTILIANCQTAGRGRLGRSFYSPEDGGIYFSILLRPKLTMKDMVLVTVAASVAVADAIFAVTKVYPQIKWVNDLYLDGKKVCGILAELVSNPDSGEPEAVVVGVGINCKAVFPEELQEIAGNISMEGADKNSLAAELSVRLSNLEEMVKTKSFLQKYRENSMVIGRYVTLLQEPGSTYLVTGIGDCGELKLESDGGEKRSLTTGEISIRLAGLD